MTRQYTWEDLQRFEKARRAVLKLDDYTNYSFVFRYWKGTIFEVIFKDVLFWFCVVLYVVMRVLFGIYGAQGGERGEGLEFFVSEGTAQISVIGTLLSLTLTPLFSAVQSQFTTNYMSSTALKGRIVEHAIILSSVSKIPKERVRRIIRLMNGAHLLSYVGLDGPYTNNFFDKINTDHKLLNKAEIEQLNKLGIVAGGPGAVHEVLSWVVRDVNKIFKEKCIPPQMAAQLRNFSLEYARNLTTVHADTFKYPFFYYHLLTLVVMVYMPLFALNAAFIADATPSLQLVDLVNLMALILQMFFAIGLRLLVSGLCDTYGEDSYDLSVMTYVLSVIKGSFGIIDAEFPEKEFV